MTPRVEYIAPGLIYKHFNWHESWVHLLRVDLWKREIRPVLVSEQFPFHMDQPILKAIDDGALSAVGGGFNLQVSHHHGSSDQPLHGLIVDKEIWTTGIGAGGYGFQWDPTQARVQQNRFEIKVWRKDLGPVDIEHINFGHDGDVVAFTWRGGDNEKPMDGKYYTVMSQINPWKQEGDKLTRVMQVLGEFIFKPPEVRAGEVVLESRWPIRGLQMGEYVRWSQSPGVSALVSGWPQLLKAGENVVKYLQLDPQKPKGPDGWFVRHNPRMVLGVDESHRYASLVAVAGRVPNEYRPHDDYSEGYRLKELATMCQQEGMYEAENMDGGGSVFEYVKDTLVVPGCYNRSGKPGGLRPDHYVMAVY